MDEVLTQGREVGEVDRGKMSRDLENVFETSLNILLEVTGKRVNHRKDLRDDITNSACSLRGVYNTIMAYLEEKTRKIDNLQCQMEKH